MIDMSVNFGGLRLSNPIILAHDRPAWDVELSKKVGIGGAGAVILGSRGFGAKWARFPIQLGGRGRPFGTMNLEVYQRWRGNGELKELVSRLTSEGAATIIVSIDAEPDPSDTARAAKEIEEMGIAHMVELSLASPFPSADNLTGFRIGSRPDITKRQVEAVKGACSLPVCIKFSLTVSDMVPSAKAAVAAGCDAITVGNAVRGFAGVDVSTGKPKVPAFGGYEGAATVPIVKRFVSEVANEVEVPVAVMGGAPTQEEIIEYIMLGATAVQVYASAVAEDYKELGTITRFLEEFMVRKGYERIEEFRGIALPYITTIEEYAKQPPRVAVVDPNKCTNIIKGDGCKVCFDVCFYDAIVFDPVMRVIESNCDGCNLCVDWCPPRAITLEDPSSYENLRTWKHLGQFWDLKYKDPEPVKRARS